MRLQKICMHCDKELLGRTDKKFCDPHCKSAFHYEQAKEQPERFFNKVDNQLRLNRRILKEYNKGGKVTVRADILKEKGFDPNYFTHYWKNNKGQIYLFIYEFGFLKTSENNKEKYLLIQWQSYMEK